MPTGGLLAIYAHPDDETFGIGGAMAKYASAGHPVTMICATRGEVGEIAPGTDATPETLGQFREQELRDAMAILGVSDVRFLDYRDSGMKGTPENADPRNLHNSMPADVIKQLVAIIRERKPDVIATWDASGGYGHPDHVAVHMHATSAFLAAADPASYPDTGEPWSAARLFYTTIPMEEFGRIMEEMQKRGMETPDFGADEAIAAIPRLAPNCVIDVEAHLEQKRGAMLAHRTQITEDGPFMNLPEDLARQFFGREYFHRVSPPLSNGRILTDFLE